MKNNNDLGSKVVVGGLFSALLVIALNKGFGELVVYAAIISLIGFLLGDFISKKYKDNKITSFVLWMNLISWLIPLAGVITTSISYGILHNASKKNKWRYTVLTVVGMILTAGSFLFTIFF